MGNVETKTSFRKAIAELSCKAQPIEPNNDTFWQQFWQEEPPLTIHDVFALITPADVRSLRECSPRNFVTFCFKLIEQIQLCCSRSVATDKDRTVVMNCVRLLTRMMPFVFEDDSFRSLLWTAAQAERAQFAGQTYYTTEAALPATKSLENGANKNNDDDDELTSTNHTQQPAVAITLLNCLADLLFCPNLTIAPLSSSTQQQTAASGSLFSGGKKSSPNANVLCDLRTTSDELCTLDSCEHIWEKGIGCIYSRPQSATFDSNRAEVLRLLMTCFSETLYVRPSRLQHHQNQQQYQHKKWIQYWTSSENRHVLPLFTSLVNVIFAYDPTKSVLLPYNHLLFRDCREPLVDIALQVLIVALEDNISAQNRQQTFSAASFDEDAALLSSSSSSTKLTTPTTNLFVSYMSRIHRDEDFHFLLAGFKRLLQNPLHATYLPNAARRVKFHQELLILLWKLCDINKRFLHYMLKTSDILDIVVPVLYHLCDARQDAARMGLVHVCVFILLLLSGERNFGVRLNKPYTTRGVPMDIPLFSGNHGDLLLIVFHRVITTGHSKIQNLFDSLLTIVVNISPYLKSLSLVAAQKLLHLFEAFSTPWFLFANATNHHLVFYLLEVFNNIIQYQFDGNAHLVYCMIRKRQLFHQLANLPTDSTLLAKSSQQSRAKLLSTIVGNNSSGGGEDLKGVVGARDDEHQASFRQDSLTSTVRTAAQVNASGDAALSNILTQTGGNIVNMNGDTAILVKDEEVSQMSKAVLGNEVLSDVNDETTNSLNNAEKSNASSPVPQQLEFLSATPAAIQMTSTSNAHELSDLRFGDSDVCKQHEQKNNSSNDDTATDACAETNGVQRNNAREGNGDFGDFSAFADESNIITTPIKSAGLLEPQKRRSSRDNSTALSTLQKGNDTSTQVNAPTPFLQSADMLVGRNASASSSTTISTQQQQQRNNKLLTPSMRSTSVTSAPDPLEVTEENNTKNNLNAKTLAVWAPTSDWVRSWKSTLPLQTIMRMLQVLVPQVEKICIDKNLTDEADIIKFLKSGTLVGLLPVPHPILIRKYQANEGTNLWFRTYMWGVVYLRNSNPPIWFETKVKLFETSQQQRGTGRVTK